MATGSTGATGANLGRVSGAKFLTKNPQKSRLFFWENIKKIQKILPKKFLGESRRIFHTEKSEFGEIIGNLCRKNLSLLAFGDFVDFCLLLLICLIF